MKRAVFLDRDGTLIEEKEYLHRPEEVVLLPGVAAALRRLQEAGFLLIMVTNQSGVGRGYFRMEDVERVHQYLSGLLARQGIRLERIYVAPEGPDVPTLGRKPAPYFLLRARDELGIDLAESFMIGDKMIDLECGWRAGVRVSLLVRTGYGAETEAALRPRMGPVLVVNDVAAAAAYILDCSCSS
jgi:D-glycero-D-manno-heptose 1,7-bisphosphate phosphatase